MVLLVMLGFFVLMHMQDRAMWQRLLTIRTEANHALVELRRTRALHCFASIPRDLNLPACFHTLRVYKCYLTPFVPTPPLVARDVMEWTTDLNSVGIPVQWNYASTIEGCSLPVVDHGVSATQ